MIIPVKKVYHGTNCEVQRGNFSKSRNDIDFGIGFYTTEDQRMAKKWASSKAVSVVNSYSINFSGLNIYTFSLGKEWLEFVKANRLQEPGYKDLLSKYNCYDVLIGPTADDKLFDTIQLYIDGYISADQAVKYLDVAGYSNQIVLKTEKALDACKFLESKTIEKAEKATVKEWIRRDRLEANLKLDELKKRDAKKQEELPYGKE